MQSMRWWQLGLCVGGMAVFHAALPADEALGNRSEETQLTMMTVGSSGERSDGGIMISDATSMRVSMEFEDANLKDVLKTFSQQTGINVIAGAEVGDRTITLYLEDVTVMDALDQILEASNLYYDRPAASQIYVVKPRLVAEPKVATVTKVYRLKYARVSSSKLARAVEALGSQTPFEAQQFTAAVGGIGGGGVGGGGGFAGRAGGEDDIGIDRVIEELLTDDGKVVVDERTNSLIVTDVAENFPRIESALTALDIKTVQILIEAEVIETTLSKAKDLGVEWSNSSEGDVISLTPSSRKTRFPFGFLREGDAPTASTGFGVSTLDASTFIGTLQAIQKDTDTKILARPKVLTLENESAVIRLTTNQAVGFETAVGETSGTRTSTPQRQTTGIILVVTPQLNEEGYVTMLVEPSVTKVVSSKVTAPSNTGTVVDPKTRSARALVRIRQGETLVMGGLIDRSDEDVVQKVPLLGDIPILGAAFRNKEITKSATELIVFVTPRILAEPSGTKVASTGSAPMAPIPAEEQPVSPSRQELIEETLNRLVNQEP